MGSSGFDWASAAISGGTSLLGGIFGAAQANANRKFQAREAQKQRDFNHAEAQLARSYNTAMVDSQNRYNSPAAMAQRYKDAGMNPALAMSGGNLGSVGIGSAPAASSSASPSGASSDFNGISNSGLASLQGLAMSSQRANIDASTDLIREQERGVRIDNDNKQRDYDDEHGLKLSMVGLNDEQRKTLEFQQRWYNSTISVLDHQSSNLEKMGELLSQDIEMKDIELAYKDLREQAELKQIYADIESSLAKAGLDRAQTQVALMLAPYYAKNLEANTNKTNIEAYSAQVDNRMMSMMRGYYGDQEVANQRFEATKEYIESLRVNNAYVVSQTDYVKFQKNLSIFNKLAGAGMLLGGAALTASGAGASVGVPVMLGGASVLGSGGFVVNGNQVAESMNKGTRVTGFHK